MTWPELLTAVFPTPWHLAAAWAVIFAAELVYVLLGFGSGLIAVGSLALILPELRDVVVIGLFINLPVELWVVGRSRKVIAWRGALLILLGLVVGIPLGGWVLTFGRPTLLLVALGLFLIVIGAAFLALPDRIRIAMPAWAGPSVGLASGLLTGIFGTGGPPLVLYHRLQGLDKTAFRGNLMFLFLTMSLVRFPAYGALGLLTPERALAAAAVFPAVGAGALVGHSIHLDLSETAFRRLVSLALVILGIVLLT